MLAVETRALQTAPAARFSKESSNLKSTGSARYHGAMDGTPAWPTWRVVVPGQRVCEPCLCPQREIDRQQAVARTNVARHFPVQIQILPEARLRVVVGFERQPTQLAA
jgi:hypothetical protein